MSDTFYVATRKGLFTFRRENGSWVQAGLDFFGDPVSIVYPDAGSGNLFAALNLGHFGVKLHRRKPGESKWEEVKAPAFANVEDESEKDDAPSVSLIWSMGRHPKSDALWAGTIPGALFRSDDFGETWSLNRTLWEKPEREMWFGGGFDKPGLHSICIHPDNPDDIRVGVSCGGVWGSQDSGETWDLLGEGLNAEYMPPDRRADKAIQDPHMVVQCSTHPDHLWTQHHNGIFKSSDRGNNWQQLHFKPSSFGFAVAVHPKDPNVAWFVPAVKDECRVPEDGMFVVVRTRDGGASHEVLKNGLPHGFAYDIVYRHALDVDGTGDRLVMGSTTGGLWVSESQGDEWINLSSHLPPVYAVHFDSK